uniref:RNA-directed RNA polymerase n=2 Tax=Equine encephalosis virus TaxID=201490 RepID=A0A7U1BC56_9REOV|nr:VP1 [Equine encephalosis virus 2]QQY96671.1 VP1 [Equine encephalosis virus 5]
MVITVDGAEVVREALNRIFKYGAFQGDTPVYEYYRYSSRIRQLRRKHGAKYSISDAEMERRRDRGELSLYGLQVITENEVTQILKLPTHDQGVEIVDIFYNSVLPCDELEPDEEFLRNYRVEENHGLQTFISYRASQEMQVFGDLPLNFWCAFIESASSYFEHEPLGLTVLRQITCDKGVLFHQNSRDLSQIEDISYTYSGPLLFEMCITESILEYNMVCRMREEKISDLQYGHDSINPFEIIREFFIMCLPHPKKINNMLRSPYSWMVKTWGICCAEQVILDSRGGPDRNSKDVFYTGYRKVVNQYGPILLKTRFFKDSLKLNREKVEEAIKYSQCLGGHRRSLNIFRSMLKKPYTTEFDPSNVRHVMLASLLLSIQTITGYGRAWVKNESSDVESQMKPNDNNLISRVSEYTGRNFYNAYAEAKEAGEEIVKPEDMYTSLLRLAKNTSSGFSTEIVVNKRFGPGISASSFEKIKISSRIKALVIFTKGHEVFTPSNLVQKYDTVEYYQTKGSRDVPIKSTRTIYAINLSILMPQLLLTLPLNEYFAKVGGSTLPDYKRLGGKVIVGDLEATGSRTMDAADCFRNSSDPMILTIAIDYSDYDQHLTPYNFRSGMLKGIRDWVKHYEHYNYDGQTVYDLIEYGYGEGRVQNSFWKGKSAVKKVDLDEYMDLNDDERFVGSFRPPRGSLPVRDRAVYDRLKCTPGKEHVVISPTDGSDLARVNTHLSGENSTLVANSLHNMAIGRIMQEEIHKYCYGKIEFLSEQYVGDDTLFYTKPHCRSPEDFDAIFDVIFNTIKKCGHEASPSKTLIAPFSVEKTQTHAKAGIYVGQDRMMIVSSERKKDIEDVGGYLASQIQTLTTKVSRGFSHELAQLVFMMKSTVIGFRKLKRTIKDTHGYRDRSFDHQEEDGFTLMMIKDPLVAFLPREWGGAGMNPLAINVVNTEEVFLDMAADPFFREIMDPLLKILQPMPPVWNETRGDKRSLSSDTAMGFFSKMARPMVRLAFDNPIVGDLVKNLPLGDYSPFNLSHTMMRSALLKEQRARALLAPGYELEYQRELSKKWKEPSFTLGSKKDMEIDSGYAKIFDVVPFGREVVESHFFPDVNISPEFYIQKVKLGHRNASRQRMSYIDRIDGILRGDVVMRGFLTSGTIMSILDDIGPVHDASDLSMLFQMLNLSSIVADRLATYISSERVKFDSLQIAKRGIGGDEFTMSLNVLTGEFMDRYLRVPPQFTKTEVDACLLYVAQLCMINCFKEGSLKRLDINVSNNERRRIRQRIARYRTFVPPMRILRRAARSERIAARMVGNQFT